MCWCNPSIRTIRCSSPNCIPPPGAHGEKPDWQVRVIEEKAQLDEKLNKLHEFIGGLRFARLEEIDRQLLLEQRRHMTDYSAVLNKRINRFNG